MRLENTLTQSMPETYGSQEAHCSFPPEITWCWVGQWAMSRTVGWLWAGQLAKTFRMLSDMPSRPSSSREASSPWLSTVELTPSLQCSSPLISPLASVPPPDYRLRQFEALSGVWSYSMWDMLICFEILWMNTVLWILSIRYNKWDSHNCILSFQLHRSGEIETVVKIFL